MDLKHLQCEPSTLDVEEIVAHALKRIETSIIKEFQWYGPEKLYNTILSDPIIQSTINSASTEIVYLIHRTIYRELITAWGLYPLGFKLIDYNPKAEYARLDNHFKLQPYPSEPVFHQRWITPHSYNDVEKACSVDPHTRTSNDYVLSIAKGLIESARYESTLTIAALKPIHQPRRPGNYSPLYDALEGKLNEGPTMFTAGGEPIWSVKTNNDEEYLEALNYAINLMKSREELDIIAALKDPRLAKH